MARLIYSTITSLDGYVADERGNFDWAAPDARRSGGMAAGIMAQTPSPEGAAMSRIRILVCRIDDRNPDHLAEIAAIDLPQVEPSALAAETALDTLEATPLPYHPAHPGAAAQHAHPGGRAGGGRSRAPGRGQPRPHAAGAARHTLSPRWLARRTEHPQAEPGMGVLLAAA